MMKCSCKEGGLRVLGTGMIVFNTFRPLIIFPGLLLFFPQLTDQTVKGIRKGNKSEWHTN